MFNARKHRERDRQTERERETERENTVRERERNTDRETNREILIHADRRIDEQKDTHSTGRQTDVQDN